MIVGTKIVGKAEIKFFYFCNQKWQFWWAARLATFEGASKLCSDCWISACMGSVVSLGSHGSVQDDSWAETSLEGRNGPSSQMIQTQPKWRFWWVRLGHFEGRLSMCSHHGIFS